MQTLAEQLSRPAYTQLGEDQQLEPVFGEGRVASLADWDERRAALRARWDAVLGKADLGAFDRSEQHVGEFEIPEGTITLFRLPTAPDAKQLVALLRPKRVLHTPCPVALVPFYNPDRMLGYDLETHERLKPATSEFARQLAQQGYMVLCGQAFPYNTVPDPGTDAGFAWWKAAAAKLHRDYPNWTGMGRLIWDTRIALDFLLRQPGVDPERVLITGHSLGGKMAFYTGCLDPRIRATIASDFGIGFTSTNWHDLWYLGDKVRDPNLGVAHHHLLALHAPRPFLLVAGDCDGPQSWQYLNAARPAYALHGRESALGMFDHASGHAPTPESMRIAYRWLAEQFALPEAEWEL